MGGEPFETLNEGMGISLTYVAQEGRQAKSEPGRYCGLVGAV